MRFTFNEFSPIEVSAKSANVQNRKKAMYVLHWFRNIARNLYFWETIKIVSVSVLISNIFLATRTWNMLDGWVIEKCLLMELLLKKKKLCISRNGFQWWTIISNTRALASTSLFTDLWLILNFKLAFYWTIGFIELGGMKIVSVILSNNCEVNRNLMLCGNYNMFE